MICKKCGVDKPLTEEFFPKREKGYFRKTCKVCWTKHRTEYRRDWREQNPKRDFENNDTAILKHFWELYKKYDENFYSTKFSICVKPERCKS